MKFRVKLSENVKQHTIKQDRLFFQFYFISNKNVKKKNHRFSCFFFLTKFHSMQKTLQLSKLLTVFIKIRFCGEDSSGNFITSTGTFWRTTVPILHESCCCPFVVTAYQWIGSTHRSTVSCKPIEGTNWAPLIIHKFNQGHFFVDIRLIFTPFRCTVI